MNNIDKIVEEFKKGNITASDEFKQALTKLQEDTREECIKIVVDEHYILEEWFAHMNDYPSNRSLYEAHQKSMETRNAITKALNQKDL